SSHGARSRHRVRSQHRVTRRRRETTRPMTDADDASRRMWMSLGLAAVGTVGAYRGAYEVLAQQARIARRVIPKPTSRPYEGDGLYRPGARSPEPWRPGMTCDVHMMIFGDSLAAGLGADSPDELPGVLLA